LCRFGILFTLPDAKSIPLGSGTAVNRFDGYRRKLRLVLYGCTELYGPYQTSKIQLSLKVLGGTHLLEWSVV